MLLKRSTHYQMCGIWTYIGDESSLETLVSIKHRGPDDFGTKTFMTPAGRLEMVGWRLSILDLSPLGHQPMSYADDRYWIVYNGEIYNYRELRADLEARGYRFRSSSDTEVLLAAYVQWGESCLLRLNGMFAFCLWDDASRKLFVARDRFGIKPLYYYNSPGGIAFASEIKQFQGLPDFQARLNPQRAYEFLAYGMLDHSHETLFQNVFQLRGGEYVHLPLGTWRSGQPLPVKRWYDLDALKKYQGSFEDASREYKRLLEDSVRLQMRADVPVGSCLSGGLDSSTIVCMMNNILNGTGESRKQKTFTSCFDIERYDERQFVQEVVSRTRVDAHYVFPKSSELFDSLEKLLWHQDEPFNSTSIYAQANVFREARASGVPVMLDGQGGDEQFGSYHLFFGPFIIGLLSRGKIPRAFQEIHAIYNLHGVKLRNILALLFSQSAPIWIDQLMRILSARPAIPTWMNADFSLSTGIRYTKPWRLNRTGESRTPSLALARTMIIDTTLPMLLHWEDRNSMAHSVEARVPFLDHRVVEFALSLPDEYKIHHGVTKWILRGASKGIVPEKILKRTDKMGFVTPEEVWMKNELKGKFREALLETTRSYPSLFRQPVLEKQFDEVIQGTRNFSNVFWRLITFGVWARLFRVTI